MFCHAFTTPITELRQLRFFIFQIPEYPVIGYGDADTESLAQTVSRLNLHCVGEEAAGVYECVADNLHGLTDKVGTRVQVASEWNKNVFCLVGTVKFH